MPIKKKVKTCSVTFSIIPIVVVSTIPVETTILILDRNIIIGNILSWGHFDCHVQTNNPAALYSKKQLCSKVASVYHDECRNGVPLYDRLLNTGGNNIKN